MKQLGAMLVAMVLSLVGSSAYADWSKIGVVDLQKIMQTSPQMTTIKENLEKQFKPRRDKLIALEGELKTNMEKLKRDTAVMTDAQKKEMEKKVITMQQQYERDGQQYQQELSSAHNEAMEGLYTKVRAAIAKVADGEKFDIILQKDATPFSISSLDVTDKVIKEIH